PSQHAASLTDFGFIPHGSALGRAAFHRRRRHGASGVPGGVERLQITPAVASQSLRDGGDGTPPSQSPSRRLGFGPLGFGSFPWCLRPGPWRFLPPLPLLPF